MAVATTTATLLTMGCSTPAPSKPDDPDVVAAREAAHRVINQELAALPGAVDHPSEFGRVEVDTCRRGENNWKVKEPFVTECMLQLAAAYSFAGDFKTHAYALHDLLGDRGWTGSGGKGIPEYVGRWDGEQRYIGLIPSTQYDRGDLDVRSKTVERLWICFGSDTSPDDWPTRFGFELGTPTMVEVATVLPYSIYYSSVTGVAWGEAWQRAGKPGPLIVVLKFDYIYFRK